MDGEVHGDEPEPSSVLELIAVPRVQHDGDVVVPVENDEALLAEHDEGRIKKLDGLAVDEQHHPESSGTDAVSWFGCCTHLRSSWIDAGRVHIIIGKSWQG